MTENADLFQRYRETGDVKIRNLIAEKYLYIAAVIAKKFVGRGVEYDDLFQVAALALVKGIERFDESKGIKFSTYITPTITGELKNYFRDCSRLVHLPRRVTELRAAIKSTEEALTQKTGKRPSAYEIASALGVTEEEVLHAAEAGSVVSLDKPVDGEEGLSLYDVIPSEDDTYEGLESRDALQAASKVLSEGERELVQFRFREGLSQAETARRMGVSQMGVSRMERKILQKLRERLVKSLAD